MAARKKTIRRKAPPRKRAKRKRASGKRAEGKRAMRKRAQATKPKARKRAKPAAKRAARRRRPAPKPMRASAPVVAESAAPIARPVLSSLSAALSVLASTAQHIGSVTHFFPQRSSALIALELPLAVGERLHVRGATSDFLMPVTSLHVDGQSVALANAGEATLHVPERARPGDALYVLRAPV